jgi:hypothetical protein
MLEIIITSLGLLFITNVIMYFIIGYQEKMFNKKVKKIETMVEVHIMNTTNNISEIHKKIVSMETK